MQEVPPKSAEQHRRRRHRHVLAVHQPRHRLPVRDGHRGEAAAAEHQARVNAHVQDLAEHRQPRRVLQRAAHGLLQRFCQKQLRGRKAFLHPGSRTPVYVSTKTSFSLFADDDDEQFNSTDQDLDVFK